VRGKDFFLPQKSQTKSGKISAPQAGGMGGGGVKRPGRKANHTPPTCPEDKNE